MKICEVIIRHFSRGRCTLSIVIINCQLSTCVLCTALTVTDVSVSSLLYNRYTVLRLRTETLFKTIMVEEKQMFIENMDLKIMISVQNSLATNVTLFPECDTCWNSMDILARPQEIDIINKVTRTYYNVRLYSCGKIITTSIMRTASKRQKLTKTILLYNV